MPVACSSLPIEVFPTRKMQSLSHSRHGTCEARQRLKGATSPSPRHIHDYRILSSFVPSAARSETRKSRARTRSSWQRIAKDGLDCGPPRSGGGVHTSEASPRMNSTYVL